MAENSPIKRNRAQNSPRKHPYEKRPALSPIQSSKSNILANNTQFPQNPTRLVKPLPALTIFTENAQDFLSFSDGSNSLFPSNKQDVNNSRNDLKKNAKNAAEGGSRLAMLDVANVANNRIQLHENNQKHSKPTFGIIGGNRRSASTSSIGFIPVNTSCTIIRGDDNKSKIVASPVPASSNTPRLVQGFGTGTALQLVQPRGLNSSFTEKFVTHLGIHSGSGDTQNKPLDSKPLGERGILTEKFDPLFDFPEYCKDILKCWGKTERKFRPKYYYMDRQTEISHRMRTILVDWMAEVAFEYGMVDQTLHLAVNYVDRFLSCMHVARTKLQLVGTTGLLIAAKFEEANPPEVADYVFVTDEAYTKDHITKMEKAMLSSLEFDLMVPTAHDFAGAYCSILRLKDPIKCLAMYLVDLALLDGIKYLIFLPSVIATAAVVLGRYTFDGIYWDDQIEKLSTHRKKTVTPCVRELHESFLNASSKQQTTFYEKYQSVRFCSISQIFIPGHGPWSK